MVPLVGVIMGSQSDWSVMEHAANTLETLGVPYEVHVMSAHSAPARVAEYATEAEGRGLEVIIAAAGMAAHLAGVTAAQTVLPGIGVPMESKLMNGLDSLLSTVQMPAGIPVATVAVGRAGAVNAAILAANIIGAGRREYREAVRAYRDAQTKAVLNSPDPRKNP